MHTIIFVLWYIFFLQQRATFKFYFNWFIKPALLVVYAKICKHNNKETLIQLNSWTRGRLIKTQELAEKGPLGVNSSRLSETTNMCNYPHSNSYSLPLRAVAVTQTDILNTDSFGAQAGRIDNYQTRDGWAPSLSPRYHTDDHPLTPIV